MRGVAGEPGVEVTGNSYRRTRRSHRLQVDLSAIAPMACGLRTWTRRFRPDQAMPSNNEPLTPRMSNASDADPHRNPDEGRSWPRCEPAFTHFELGASSELRPTAVMAKRYTPRYGVRKE
jgi:hypothetical protein